MPDRPLGYYRPDPARHDAAERRPLAVTVIAWVGIALCSLILLVFLSGVASGASSASSPGALIQRGDRQSVAAIGFVIGFVARWAFYILMLAGCMGLLASRRGARRLVIVCAYAWIILTVIEIFFIVWSVNSALGTPAARTRGNPNPPLNFPTSNQILLIIGISCAVGIAFPFSAIAVLRRPVAEQFFRRRYAISAAPIAALGVERFAAWAALAIGSFLILNESVQFFAWITRDAQTIGRTGVYNAASYAIAGASATATPMMLLTVLSRIALVTAAVLAVRRVPASRGLMTIACLALIILESARYVGFTDLLGYRPVAGSSPDVLDWFRAHTNVLGGALRTVFPYVLLLLIFLPPRAQVQQELLPERAPLNLTPENWTRALREFEQEEERK